MKQASALKRHGLLALLLAALFARALVPQGYMPEVDRGGSLLIRLCEGGTIAIPLRAAPSPDHNDAAHGNDHPCAFAGLAAFGDVPTGPAFVALSPLAHEVPKLERTATLPVPALALRPPSRAPPQPV